MSLPIYSTDVLVESVKKQKLVPSFLRNRYFPTSEKDIFATGDVLVEYKEGSQKLAPFVHPRKGGVTLAREGYQVNRYTPANVAPKRVLTTDDLKAKGFGEALFANEKPAQREAKLLAQDLVDLDESITFREEAMSAEVILTGGCIMKHITDDPSKPEEREIRFYDEVSNPNQYTPDVEWGATGSKILADLFAICQDRSKKGLASTDLLTSPSALLALMQDEAILKLLDTKNYDAGKIETTELPDGAKILGKLNVFGYLLSIISYNATYTNDEGVETSYITDGKAVVTAPALGHTLYGAVSIINDDKVRRDYVAKRVPKLITDENTDSRELRMTSKPLIAPHQKAAFTVINAVTPSN